MFSHLEGLGLDLYVKLGLWFHVYLRLYSRGVLPSLALLLCWLMWYKENTDILY